MSGAGEGSAPASRSGGDPLDAPADNAACLFCGEPERFEIVEVWGHEFIFETCCETVTWTVKPGVSAATWAVSLGRTEPFAKAKTVFFEPGRNQAASDPELLASIQSGVHHLLLDGCQALSTRFAKHASYWSVMASVIEPNERRPGTRHQGCDDFGA